MMLTVMNNDGAGPPQPVAAAAEKSSTPAGWVVLGALVSVALGVWLAYLVWDNGDEPKLWVPRSDYTALAGVILLAAAIERLLEPISYYLLPADKKETAAANEKASATTKAGDPGVSVAAVNAATKDAADAAADLAKRQAERKIAFWAIATIVGLFGSAIMGVFLIGSLTDLATGARPNRVLDLAVTGLVIGAGTKVTHDLITSLKKPAPT